MRCDKEKLRRRHKIENFFCRLKQFKRIKTRGDTLRPVSILIATRPQSPQHEFLGLDKQADYCPRRKNLQ